MMSFSFKRRTLRPIAFLLCVDVVLVCSSDKTAMPLAWSVLESLMNASLVANVGHLRLGFISHLQYHIVLMVC